MTLPKAHHTHLAARVGLSLGFALWLVNGTKKLGLVRVRFRVRV